MSTQKFLVAILALAAVPGAANQLAVYSTQASFEAANPTFQNLPIALAGTAVTLTETALDNSQFIFTEVGIGGIQGVASISGWGSGNVIRGAGNGGEIDITLPAAVRAFGFYAGVIGPGYQPTISYTSGSAIAPFTLSFSSGDPTFYGVLTDAPITNFVFSTTFPTTLGLTNCEFADQTQTPEAATLLLIGFGLIAMRWLHRRHRALARPAVARCVQYPPAIPGRA
jgi:hypothetical protein